MKLESIRVPVRLYPAAGSDCGPQPLTFGVPFAEGVLPAGSKLRCLTGDGRELPVQTATMTTWKNDLREVKWLLVDLQADPARDGETVWLEKAGLSDESDKSDKQISTTAADGLLTIDTGALRLRLRTDFAPWKHRQNDSVFAGCEIKTAEGWRAVLREDCIQLYMKDACGNLYDSSGISPAPRVMVEEEGPLRVCVRIDGHLRSQAGLLFCPFRLRLHLYAGRTDMRIFHTFIFNQDPTRVELAGIGLKVLACPGDGALAALGAEGGGAYWCRNWQELKLLQSDDRAYHVERDGVTFGQGGRFPGWASLGGADSSLLAVVRDGWQECPKGLCIERDSLDVRIWPDDHPEPLSFLTPLREPCINFRNTRDEEEVKRLLAENPTAPLWLSSFHARTEEEVRWVERMVELYAPDRVASYNDVGTDNGLGAAKTTEVLLHFTEGLIADGPAASMAAAVQSPAVAVVDPDYLCATGAVEHLQPVGDPRFVSADAVMDSGNFEFCLMDPVEQYRLYGMMRYGNLINNHGNSPEHTRSIYQETEPEKVLRFFGAYNNEARDHILAAWCHFLRTGQPSYLRPAQLASRAAADVGFVHAYPDDPDRVGVIHYHNLHVWSGVLCRSHSIIGGIMMDYYMTGNRRMLDVALEAADQVVRVQNPSGILNCFYGNSLNREYVGPLSILFDAYQATWQDRYGSLAERSLAWLLRVAPAPGLLPRDIYTVGPRGNEAIIAGPLAPAGFCGNHYHMWSSALRLFPSRQLKDFLVACGDHWIRDAHAAPGFALNNYDSPALCLAYDITGNPDYAVCALKWVQRFRPAPDDSHYFVQYLLSGFLPRLMRTVATAMERDPQGFAASLEQWQEKREEGGDKQSQQSAPIGETRLGRVCACPFTPDIE